MSVFDDKLLLGKLQQGDKKAFSLVFSNFYKDLVIFARTFTKDTETAEEIVQDIFVKFWEYRHFINVSLSIKSYLLKATQNKCLDWLKHQKVKEQYKQAQQYIVQLSENNTDNYLLYSELEANIEKALSTLPADVAESFRMSRFEGLKYHEIAEKQAVSVRTVEVRIGRALQLLREELKDYLWILLLIR